MENLHEALAGVELKCHELNGEIQKLIANKNVLDIGFKDGSYEDMRKKRKEINEQIRDLEAEFFPLKLESDKIRTKLWLEDCGRKIESDNLRKVETEDVLDYRKMLRVHVEVFEKHLDFTQAYLTRAEKRENAIVDLLKKLTR